MSNFSDACKPFMAFSKPWHICISSISFTGDHTPLLPLSHLFPKIKIFSFLGNRSLPCHCCKGVHGHGYHENDEEGDEQWHYAKAQGGADGEYMYPDKHVNEVIRQAAADAGIKVHEAPIHSSDIFYYQDGYAKGLQLNKEKGCVCVEMESFALFHNANVTGKHAACLLTISDSLITGKETTAEERQNNFNEMIKVALEAAARLDK
jgi:hypothetical protein